MKRKRLYVRSMLVYYYARRLVRYRKLGPESPELWYSASVGTEESNR